MMDRQKVLELMDRFEKGLCTPAELRLLERIFFDTLKPEEQPLDVELLARVDEHLKSRLTQHFSHTGSKRQKAVVVRWLSAAAALLLLAAGLFYFYPEQGRGEQGNALLLTDISPGGNSAKLILTNGRSIDLSDQQEGIIITGDQIIYPDGSVAIDRDQYAATTESYSVKTPNGGQYQMSLPDGTRVWLNAATTIRFPVNYNDQSTRRVEVDGEAYFEVVKNGKPFKVVGRDQEIEVLGTSFNVSSYADDVAVRTTLIEGSVRVRPLSRPGASAAGYVITPGQQSIVSDKSVDIVNADLEQAVDWKNGDFVFNKQSLAQIMLKISRWYDVDISYSAKVDTQQTFSGQISRTRYLSEVLHVLTSTGSVKFELTEGKAVNVLPGQ